MGGRMSRVDRTPTTMALHIRVWSWLHGASSGAMAGASLSS